MSQDMPSIRLETTEGDILLELWSEVAPRHAENFRQLVHEGFYDGLTFHRVIPGFMIQSGCPIGDGTGGPGWTINAEFNDRPHEKGVLSMARTADPNSAGSQFFICLDREHCQHLDHEYTAFGRVVEGMDAVDAIAATPLVNADLGTPAQAPQVIHGYEVYGDDMSD